MTACEQINELGLKVSVQRHPSELTLMSAYVLFASDGLLDTIWHHKEAPSPSQFLAEAKARDTIYYGCFVEENGRVMLAGLGWAFDMTPLGDTGRFRATVGQAFLRQFWKWDIAKELASACLDDGFEQCGIEVAYGFTPVPNPAAVRFVSKMGFTKVGVAPSYSSFAGKPCDVVISCCTRAQWNSPKEGR